ncbi:MAG: leucine-rich repeat domain-containing protein [Paracoccaceae bacterium]
MKALFRHLLIASIALMAPPVLAQDDCVEFRDRCVKQNRTSLSIDISSASDDLAGIEQLSWLERVWVRGKGEDIAQVYISILSELPELTFISLENVKLATGSDLSGHNIIELFIKGGAPDFVVLEQLPKLETLRLADLSGEIQLNLGELHNLQTVWLDNVKLATGSDLSSRNIIELSIKGGAPDADVLEQSSNLEPSRLPKFSDVTQFTLGELPNLQHLSVVNATITNPSELSNMTNLQSLWLLQAGITDLSVIADLDLKALLLRGEGLRDFTPLAQMKNISYLSLFSAGFTSLDGLDLGENFQVLAAEDSVLQDISGLANAINLKILSLPGSQITNLDVLENLAQLEILNVPETPLNDVSGLEHHPKLETLLLNDTKVTDLSPLAGLVNLETLDLSRILATDLSVLAELDNLQKLRLDGTTATDLTPLLDMDALKEISINSQSIIGKENLRAFIEDFGK